MNENPTAEEAAAAFSSHPGVNALIFPLADGFPSTASDVRVLLAETGLKVDYASDPATVGVVDWKSADIILPLVMFVATNSLDAKAAVDAIVSVVRNFVDNRAPTPTVRVRAGRLRILDKVDLRYAEVTTPADSKAAVAAVHDALSNLFRD